MLTAIESERLEWIASKSLVNCHAIGVDSILFDDTPGARVRAFVAHPRHTLWQNCGTNVPLSVAIHPHHCDVRLTPINGRVFNVTPIGQIAGKRYAAYKYESAVTGSGKFSRADEDEDFRIALQIKQIKRPLSMPAKQEHTVYVPQGEPAAWYVNEGTEDRTYSGLCWSDADLDKFDFDPFYKPMTIDHLLWLLKLIKLPTSNRTADSAGFR